MNPKTKGISPKLFAAIASAVITYLLAQTALDLPEGVVVALQAVAIAISVWVAPPGDVVYDTAPTTMVPPSEGTRPVS